MWGVLQMQRKNVDLIAVIGIGVLNILWAFLPYHITLVQTVLALPLLFVTPGYTVTEALFKHQPPVSNERVSSTSSSGMRRSLTVSDRLILSVGLSLSIDIVSGFILNLLPIGLNAVSWAVFLGLLTIILSFLILFLRRGVPQSDRQPREFRIDIRVGILFWLSIVVVLFSILYSALSAYRQPTSGFTQLWMLPPTQSEQNCAVHLGIHSFEAAPVTYRLTMAVDGKLTESWLSIALTPHQEWNQAVLLTVKNTKSAYVQANLYRLDKPGVLYRSVHLMLHNMSDGKNEKAVSCST